MRRWENLFESGSFVCRRFCALGKICSVLWRYHHQLFLLVSFIDGMTMASWFPESACTSKKCALRDVQYHTNSFFPYPWLVWVEGINALHSRVGAASAGWVICCIRVWEQHLWAEWCVGDHTSLLYVFLARMNAWISAVQCKCVCQQNIWSWENAGIKRSSSLCTFFALIRLVDMMIMAEFITTFDRALWNHLVVGCDGPRGIQNNIWFSTIICLVVVMVIVKFVSFITTFDSALWFIWYLWWWLWNISPHWIEHYTRIQAHGAEP